MILDKIVKHKKVEVEQQKSEVSLEELKNKIATLEDTRDFKGALEAEGMSLIAEIKKASPSKGIIREDFNPIAIAKEYQQAGARILSVLTDEEFFKGKLEYLVEVKAEVDLPLLRKDFIVDSYQIYQARACGADAILLIVSILSKEQLNEYLALAKSLGLDVLVEVHNRRELALALQENCDIIGINNRDLRVFEVDLATTLGLKRLIPKDKVVVSESGIKNRNDVKLLTTHGIDGILVGEALMRSTNISTKISELVG